MTGVNATVIALPSGAMAVFNEFLLAVRRTNCVPCTKNTVSPSRIVLRKNFDILIELVAALENGSSQYTQVFAIDYPTLTLPAYFHKPMICRKVHTNLYSICMHGNQILHQLDFDRQIAFQNPQLPQQIIPFEYDRSLEASRQKERYYLL